VHAHPYDGCTFGRARAACAHPAGTSTTTTISIIEQAGIASARRYVVHQDFSTPSGRSPARAWLGALAALASLPAHASMFSGDTLDAVANGIAWVVICIVPIIAIAVFWIVHVMPEKIAHKRHHPQVDAIHTLCLLSLVFGGLLWPIAWLWAYTKPTS
jgi:hypothetical protein